MAVGKGEIKININVTFQEISNTMQKFELGKASLPLKEQYKMLGYNEESERDDLYNAKMQELRDIADADLGTQSNETIPEEVIIEDQDVIE